jgi:hypothetical protein
MSFELTGDTSIIYSLTAGRQVTDQQLRQCAVNYSTSFGVWSAHAAQKLGAYAIKGTSKSGYVFI